jgi:hypothetical protein
MLLGWRSCYRCCCHVGANGAERTLESDRSPSECGLTERTWLLCF